MTIDELIESGWQRHAEHSTAVADQLEQSVALVTEAAKASAFLGLSNHTIGEHLADWSRAETLADRVVGNLPETPQMTGAWMAQALAHLLNGNWAAALARQADIVRLGPDSATVVQIKLSIQAAKALVAARRVDEGAALFAASLALAEAKGEPASDRTMAIACNGLASDLLESSQRSDEMCELMRAAAQAAELFWGRCGTWVNLERALYLRALVHNALEEPELARDHARTALKTIASNGVEKVDEAFLHLALADSFRILGDSVLHTHHLGEADALARQFPDDNGLLTWFSAERAKVSGEPVGAT